MKKNLLVLLITPLIFFESCKSDFNINAPYEDVFVLNCILRSDNSIQYAILSKNTFTDNGTAPTSNGNALNIKGANIKIVYNDSVFVMKDTTIQVTDAGNISNVNCYYVKNLIISPGKIISIEASVPGGKTLKSTIQVQNISFSNFSTNFPLTFQTGYQIKDSYSWSWIGGTQSGADILNQPQLEIYYKKYEGGKLVDKMMLIPLVYYYTADEYGNSIPVNVKFSFVDNCMTNLETINKTMQEISGDDPNKGNYIINKVLFSVVSFDPDLTKFYSAYSTYTENFTVKLRQTDYTNIDGGKGIFGAYYKFSQPLVVDGSYIQSYGYQYDPM
jgi:hypothetical protein